jgi:hypothetical protein
MKRRGILLVAAAALLFLTGCGINFLNGQNVVFGIVPAPLGYEVSEQGIEIPLHRIKLHSRKGAMGALVRGYNVYYFDQNGNPLIPGDSEVYSDDSLNVYVPAGIRCDDPDPDVGCTIHSAGARFAEGYQVESQDTLLLAGAIALEMEYWFFNTGNYPVGWYAEIELFGTDDANRDFVTRRLRVDINVPVNH